MPTSPRWSRRWGTTAARGAVALVPAVLAALAFGLVGVRAHGGGFVWSDVLAVLGLLIAVPALWLVPMGALVDHFLSRWGATVVALAHVCGGVVAFLVWYMGLLAFAAVSGEGLGGAFAILLVLAVPPWMLVGFALAWLVPGSFPHRRGLVLDGVAWVRRRRLDGSVAVARVHRP